MSTNILRTRRRTARLTADATTPTDRPAPVADLVAAARRLAEQHLKDDLPDRWAHTMMVAAEARRLADILAPGVADLIESAAWLHDVAYAENLAHNKFHPVDGAAFAAAQGFPSSVAQLVAHHSGAEHEARERGLLAQLHQFPSPPTLWLDIVSCADLCTGPTGEIVDPAERLGEVLDRYAPDHPVHRAIAGSSMALIESANQIIEHAQVQAEIRRTTTARRAQIQDGAAVSTVKALAAQHGWRYGEDSADRCTLITGSGHQIVLWWGENGADADYAIHISPAGDTHADGTGESAVLDSVEQWITAAR